MTDHHDRFTALTKAEKQRFLALVALDLTIAGRSFLRDRQGDPLVRAMSGLNELQHTIAGQIAALASDREHYPDDVFWQMLTEKADRFGIAAALQAAVEFAASRR